MPSTESEDSKWLRVKTFAAVCGFSPFCITISTLDVTILQSQPQKSFFFVVVCSSGYRNLIDLLAVRSLKRIEKKTNWLVLTAIDWQKTAN